MTMLLREALKTKETKVAAKNPTIPKWARTAIYVIAGIGIVLLALMTALTVVWLVEAAKLILRTLYTAPFAFWLNLTSG